MRAKRARAAAVPLCANAHGRPTWAHQLKRPLFCSASLTWSVVLGDKHAISKYKRLVGRLGARHALGLLD